MELFYRVYGSGTPVIILHGLFGMSDNWISAGKKIAENHMVIIPDLRNHGNSLHSEEFNLNILTEDIIGLFHQLHFDNATIIGHSLGGRIAISATLKYPELFNKLIVVDIAPRKYSGNLSIDILLKVMNRLVLSDKKSLTEIDDSLKIFINNVSVRQLILKNITKDEKGVYKWKLNFEVIRRNVETLMSPVFEETTFTKPTLFLKGGLSDFIKADDYAIIYKYFPNAEIDILPKAGHWVHADEPQIFIDKVQSFLKGCN